MTKKPKKARKYKFKNNKHTYDCHTCDEEMDLTPEQRKGIDPIICSEGHEEKLDFTNIEKIMRIWI
jgi:hypothetical protein